MMIRSYLAWDRLGAGFTQPEVASLFSLRQSGKWQCSLLSAMSNRLHDFIRQRHQQLRESCTKSFRTQRSPVMTPL